MVTSPTDTRSERSAQLFAAALNSLTVHVAMVDSDGTILAVNDAWRRFAEQNGGGARLCEGADYLTGSAGGAETDRDAEAATAGVRAVLRGEVAEFRLEYPCHSPTELRWFELRATPLQGSDRGGAVVVHSAITARKLAEQRLEFLAHHDELTGMPNRRRVMQALAEAQPSGRLGVLLIDLDRFKAINDTHGHAAGNDVLCAVADALGAPFGRGSLAGRHGGDEFCVALFDCDAGDVRAAAGLACARVRERLGRLAVAVGASVSVGGTAVAADEPLASAMERADAALYEVKGAGRDGFRVA